jgi:hypothetical protein
LTPLYIVAAINPPLEISFVIAISRRLLVGAGLTTALVFPFDASSQNPPVASGRVGAGTLASPGYDTSAFAALRWREIGPFRGGRSVAAAGLSPINASLKAQGLPPIVPSAEETKAVPSQAVPSGSSDDEVEK